MSASAPETRSGASAERLFHLVDRPTWERLRASTAPYAPPSLASEGFVHLSFAAQLAGSAAAHFAGRGELVLLEVLLRPAADAAHAERAALRVETSRGGAAFPHLYRALERAELVRAWPLGDASDPTLPRLGPSPETDRPQGEPAA
jgi:uncharacterized protein (DUF952 family)